jgi:hypothetical protein
VLIGIDAAAVEFTRREEFSQMLNQRLLECGVAEIAKAVRSKKADLLSGNALPQKLDPLRQAK